MRKKKGGAIAAFFLNDACNNNDDLLAERMDIEFLQRSPEQPGPRSVLLPGVWCAVGYYLVNHPLLGRQLRRWGRLLLPFVLVALGLLILSRALVLIRG